MSVLVDDGLLVRISSINVEGNSIQLTWTSPAARTNLVEAAASPLGPFATVSPPLTTGSNVPAPLNFLDSGALTNGPVRYYRVRAY